MGEWAQLTAEDAESDNVAWYRQDASNMHHFGSCRAFPLSEVMVPRFWLTNPEFVAIPKVAALIEAAEGALDHIDVVCAFDALADALAALEASDG